jgi:hypothetical protein
MATYGTGHNLHTPHSENKSMGSKDSGGREMKKPLSLILSVIVFSLLSACGPGANIEVTTNTSTIQLRVPGPNPLVNQPDTQGQVAQAAAGLWHGLIAPITLVISFFEPDVQMYEVHNSGTAYNFGFFLGEALVFGLFSLFLRIRRTA